MKKILGAPRIFIPCSVVLKSDDENRALLLPIIPVGSVSPALPRRHFKCLQIGFFVYKYNFNLLTGTVALTKSTQIRSRPQ